MSSLVFKEGYDGHFGRLYGGEPKARGAAESTKAAAILDVA